MKVFVIDRFEGDIAVCEQEDGSMVNILKEDLPEGCHEGSVLRVGEDGEFTADLEEEARRRAAAAALERMVFGPEE